LDTRELGEPVSIITILYQHTECQKTVVRGSKIPDAGYGLFAAEAIRKGRVIGGKSHRVDFADELEYTGEVIDTGETDRRS
jgi:SET domain-containing protein